MSKPFLTFGAPDIGEEEIAEVTAILRSGWISSGSRMRQFEKDFVAYLGNDCHAVAVNSATAGLHLALEALGVGPGDEVIVPTYTFTASAEVIRYLGADPVFIDCDFHTLNITPESIERAITPQTKAIMPVHMAGLPCDMLSIIQLAKKHGLYVVEDAAHALPSTYKGQLVGTFESDATVFSFYANKTMTTAEGGMLVTSNEQIAKRSQIMRLHGIDRDAFDRYNSSLPAWYYEVVAPGYKYNMTDIAAAIGIHQLKKLDRFQKKRDGMAMRFMEALSDLPISLPALPSSDDKHAWHLFIVRITEQCRVNRDEFIQLMTERGIGTGVHYIPLHRHPYWRETYRLSASDFPAAEAASHQVVSIPLHTRMDREDEQRVIDAMHGILS